jgi:AcrR family transcriptional regulator
MADRTRRAAGRKNDPEGLRRRLVDAAYAAFTTRGYRATSVHDLKRETGATGGALSHHFPAKKDLALAVLQDRVAAIVEETWMRPVVTAATAGAGILAVFDAIAGELEAQGSVSGCPLNNLALELAGEDEDFRHAIDAVFLQWRDAIAEKIRADQAAAGADTSVDPEAFAILVVATYSGAMAMAKASQSAAPLRTCAEQLTKLMRDWRVA